LEVGSGRPEVVPLSSPSADDSTSSLTEERVLDRTAPDTVPVAELRDVNVAGVVKALPPSASEVPVSAPLNQGGELNMPEPVLSETHRTLERYKKAIERIKKALELRREEWEQFELSGFDSLPHVGETDFKSLQFQIDKVLDSRNKASQNRSKWQKSKDLVEQCFTALAPFMKNVLSIAQQAAQVIYLLKVSNKKIPVLNSYGLLFGGVLLLITVKPQRSWANQRSRNKKSPLVPTRNRPSITYLGKSVGSVSCTISLTGTMEFLPKRWETGAWMSSQPRSITSPFIWHMNVLAWELAVISASLKSS
jgi:hypothetical protein